MLHARDFAPHPGRVGIGITTFDRVDRLIETIERIRRHTSTPHRLLVADDGSTDGTLAWLREQGIPHVTGENRGIAWNKNRLLFGLGTVARCKTIITIEDDTSPRQDGWERDWVAAALRWGHVNYAADFLRTHFVEGRGSADDPFRSTIITGQCAAFSAAALRIVGFMDTRFRRYGYEHAEHSARLRRAGFGGEDARELYYLIGSDLDIADLHAQLHTHELPVNGAIFLQVMGDPTLYRQPWRSRVERRTLLLEMARARHVGPLFTLCAAAKLAAAETEKVSNDVRLWTKRRVGGSRSQAPS